MPRKHFMVPVPKTVSYIVQQQIIGTTRNFVYLITAVAGDQKESFVVDPQPDLAPWEKQLSALESTLKGILLTHTHHDHVGGVGKVVDKYKVPVFVHKADVHRISKSAAKESFVFIENDQVLKLNGLNICVLHTPGHSAGECCFYVSNSEAAAGHAQSCLFTGDTVFIGDVGRTDLDTGSTKDMYESLQKIKSLPTETVIYPGHDYGPAPTATIGEQMRTSAAFRCKSVEELDALP